MPKFATRSTYTFAFLTIWAVIVVCDLVVAYAWVVEQRSTHWAVDGPGAVGHLLDIGLKGMGGFVLTGLALTELVVRASTWWRVAWIVAFTSGLANLFSSLIFFGERGWAILYRDLVSVTIASVLITVLIARLSQYHSNKGTGTLKFVLLSGVTTILLVYVFLFVSLFVHCTSGDCL